LPEKDHFRGLIQRVTAVIALRGHLNELYERAAENAWTVEETEPNSQT